MASIHHAAYWLELSDNGRLRVGLGDGTGSVKLFSNVSQKLTTGHWVHWTVVKEGSSLYSYINGELYTSRSVPELSPKRSPSNGTWKEIVGAINKGTALNYEGRIDDLRVWLVARPPSAPYAHWKFEQEDNLGYDSASGNHGIARNGASQYQSLDEKPGGQPGEAAILYGNRGDYIQIGEDDDFPLIPDGNETNDYPSVKFGVEHFIRILNSSNVLIKNCDIRNIDRDESRVFALRIEERAGASTHTRDIRVESCNFENIAYSGNGATAAFNSRAVLINSSATDNDMTDIVIDKCNFLKIRSSNNHHDGDCINIDVRVPTEERLLGDNPLFDFTVTECNFEDYSKRGVKCQADRCYVGHNVFHHPNLDISWAPAIAFFGSNSQAEWNVIDYPDEHDGWGFTIGGSSNRMNNNTITLSDTPVEIYSNGNPGRSSGFYFGSNSNNGRFNVMEENIVIGGLYGLLVLQHASDNIFRKNDLGVIFEPYHTFGNASNIIEDNNLLP